MESVLGRYRNLIILVGVLFLQVLGLAMQVKRGSNEAENTRLIRIWAVGAITPFERGLLWIQNGAGNLWHNYFYLRGVRAENRQLKEQIEQMHLEQVRLSEDAAQARRLQTLLAFKEQFISRTVAAQVIGSSGSDLSRIVYIDKGEKAGVRRDMAVITADGIVGKVLMVYPSVSQVLLINDQSSGVGAILEKSRLQGVLRGTQNGEVALERVMSDEQVPLGEVVLTSGGDQIFPKGLRVGTVAKVGNGKDLFLNIRIKPAANLSKLEEVLVLVEKQERQATADDSVRVRAADILAQRLPSVPDKPATDANTASNPAIGNSGATGATTPRTATGQPTRTTAKPPASTGSITPLGSSVVPKPTASAGAPHAAANPVAFGDAQGSSASGQSGRPAGSTSSVPKKADGANTKATPAQPDASQATPTSSQPALTEPPPPQSNPQPPASESGPN